MSDPKLTDSESQFHIAEYNALRTEILTHIRDVRIMQRGSILGIALFFGWYLSSAETLKNLLAQIVIIWLPLTVLFFVAKLSIMKIDSVHEAGRYIAKIEQELSHAKIGGWENHLTALRNIDPKAVKADRVDKAFWFTVGLLVSLISVLETLRLVRLL